MAVFQTFGNHTNFHPHIHVLVTEEGTALTFEADRPPQLHIAHQELLIAAEERGEYL